MRLPQLNLDGLSTIVKWRPKLEDVQSGGDRDIQQIVCVVPSWAHSAKSPTCSVHARQGLLREAETCLLPYPNENADPSRAVVWIRPLRMNRSGLNSSGESYTSGSWSIPLTFTHVYKLFRASVRWQPL